MKKYLPYIIATYKNIKMKFALVLFFVLVLPVANLKQLLEGKGRTNISFSMPSKGSTKAALNKTKKDCITDCGDVYKPVCAGDGSGKGNKSFGSECVLTKYNCESGNQLKVVSQGECPGGGGVRLQ
ncbi:unnamed protein product [Callosobruchus maculatus]|uniref:Kazal-like domain-containing protein n=1 Tax=Callosobruchus maculatus TaxID=64391 RepID=A0A653CW58_CALMS|nr:unnamed protein product [Callosobruchus maculatus]